MKIIMMWMTTWMAFLVSNDRVPSYIVNIIVHGCLSCKDDDMIAPPSPASPPPPPPPPPPPRPKSMYY